MSLVNRRPKLGLKLDSYPGSSDLVETRRTNQVDPVLKKRTYNGFNVNRAARIEPITEEGQVFVSQAFAALAAVVPKKNFRCDYAGTRQLAKKAGAIPVFVLRETR